MFSQQFFQKNLEHLFLKTPLHDSDKLTAFLQGIYFQMFWYTQKNSASISVSMHLKAACCIEKEWTFTIRNECL